MHTTVVLDNIRSAHNVGAIFRTADGAGVSEIWLVGTTPTPTDRFGRRQPEIKKTSLGAAESMPWTYFENVAKCIKALKEKRLTIVVVEQEAEAIPYRAFTQNKDTAYVFGNEIDGVAKEFIDAGEAIIHIPMNGEKESLNVSVAAGIILFNTPPHQ